MKFLQLIKKGAEAPEVLEEGVLYYDENTESISLKKGGEPVPPVTPEITITVEDAFDTDIIALTATKNETVQGEISWTCNLASSIAEINGTTLTFKQHYEGSVSLTATASNASAEKTITVSCEEVATATTYSIKTDSISIAETQPMDASSTSATVNFVGVTTQHYKLKEDYSVESNETQTVEFEANDTTEAATRNGSFKWNGENVAWEVNLKAKEDKPTIELVDLGLPSGIKWASCNVGATKPEEPGKYFQWGDTLGYTGDEALAHSTWSTAPFNNGSSSYDGTYFSTVSGTVCPNGVLAAQYDAATANLGEDYRMPTKAEYDELIANTTSTWFASDNTEFNGVAGRKFTSKTDSSKYIFIPAAGYCYSGSFDDVGSYGSVWASSLFSGNPNYAWYLNFGSGSVSMGSGSRYYGFSVRAVSKN